MDGTPQESRTRRGGGERLTCAHCGHECPAGANFCTQCGEALARRCPRCGADLAAAARFCAECGGALAGREADALRPAPGFHEAERRYITVAFFDLIGSTELSQRIDPEDLRAMVKAYQEVCGEIVRGLGGEIAQYLGDGVLVYFGASHAHEDDPIRAVRAALAVVGAVPELNERLAAQIPAAGANPLHLRVAVHTGPVVLGEMGSGTKKERLALGDTMNTAARMLEVAKPETVLVSDATRHLIQGVFVLRELGDQQLRGIAEPMPIWAVLRATGVHSRFDAGAERDRTPLMGREQEIGLLLDRWDQANEGQGRVVLLSGEAGIGKTRLVRVLRERLSRRAHTWLECHCSAYHQSSALYPVVDLLQKGLHLSAEESPKDQLAKLERGVAGVGLPQADVVPLFASLLAIELPDGTPPLELDASERRRRMLEALTRWLLALVEHQPLILVVEDLHWCDPSTLELLGMVIDQTPTVPLLLLATFRPEFTPPWSSRTHVAHLPIHPLTRRQMARMIEALTSDEPLPEAIVEEVIARSDGVPLFVEEFTKALQEESGRGPSEDRGRGGELAIPFSLQASLMARIDRLGEARDVVQTCAVLGREFSHELLEAVSSLDATTLAQRLDVLAGAELLYRRGVPPRATYVFKHALIQDTAYQSLLRSRRQELHARIAPILEERFPERAAAQPEVVARHWEEGGFPERAAAYYLRAGERLTQQAANAEAIWHLEKGLEMLRALPETPERNRKEMRLQVALGVPLQAAKGNADPQVEAVYERARELCDGPEDEPMLFRALRGLFAARQVRGELGPAIELGERLLGLAERNRQPAELLQAHLALGSPYLYQGRFAESLEHLEEAMRLYDPVEHHALAYLYGLDQGVNSRAYAAIALFALGYPDRADATSRAAISLGRRVNHPYSLATALGWAAVLHQLRCEPEQARERAEEAIALSRECGFPTFLGLGTFYRGWAASVAGDPARGIAECRSGLDLLAESGTGVGAPQLLGILAEAQQRAGRGDEALETVDSALRLSGRTGQAVFDAELHRLRGELLAARAGDDATEAQAELRLAVETARRQQARSYELRAAQSLGRLLVRRGERSAARALLAEVLDWFGEEVDTADLRDARASRQQWS